MLDVQTLKNYVGAEHAAEIEALTANCESSRLQNLTFKSPKLALILAIFLGFLGIDRLYQGGIKMMLIKWVMIVMSFGTWCIADLYYTRHAVQQQNYEKLLSAVAVA